MPDEPLDDRPEGAVLSADTSAAIERLLISRWRKMTPSEKLRILADAYASTRELAFAGIRQRHPAATDAEHTVRFARLTLGRALADEAYPEARPLPTP